MVGFGDHLGRERHTPWAAHYVNYDLLKRKLDEVVGANGPDSQDVFAAQKHIFQGLCDTEIEKVLDFYSSKGADVEAAAAACAEHADAVLRDDLTSASLTPQQKAERLEEAVARLEPCALDIFHLLGYVSLNMAAIRKICKKYAKHIAPDKPHPGYLTLKIEHPHDPGWSVLQATFLPERVGAAIADMQRHNLPHAAAAKVRETYGRLAAALDRLSAEHPEARGSGSGRFGTSAAPAAEELALTRQRKTLARIVSSRGSFKYTPKLHKRGASATSAGPPVAIREMEELLEALSAAEASADRNAGLVTAQGWAELQAGIFEPAPEDANAVATTAGLWLNCINSGLYMANYNLIIPTITDLCAHIGAKNSMVGVLIGACDIATVVSTMGYSVWTNTSYKRPLIASAVACLAGNLLYALSYDAKAVWLLFLARLITGFGSARTVNRRYIAMFVARSNRTNASALFVSLSAVGMALGPLLSLPLSYFPDLTIAGLTVNYITAGGWIMNIAWLLFMVLSWFLLDEPLDKIPREEEPLQQPLLSDMEAGEAPDAPDAPDGTITANGENGLIKGGKAPGFGSVAEGKKDDAWRDEFWPRVRRLWDSPFVCTLCCIFLCFILKVVQQAYIDGLPIFTLGIYGWTQSECGILLGALGLAAPLVNQSVGGLSARLSDRLITVGSILVTGAGAVVLTHGAFPRWSFFAGGVAVYMGTIVLEAVSMSLTSKVIDERLAKGLWNAGLLSTQAGTIGRLCGNLLLSACARVTGAVAEPQLEHLASVLFGSAFVFMVFSLAYVLALYGRLVA